MMGLGGGCVCGGGRATPCTQQQRRDPTAHPFPAPPPLLLLLLLQARMSVLTPEDDGSAWAGEEMRGAAHRDDQGAIQHGVRGQARAQPAGEEEGAREGCPGYAAKPYRLPPPPGPLTPHIPAIRRRDAATLATQRVLWQAASEGYTPPPAGAAAALRGPGLPPRPSAAAAPAPGGGGPERGGFGARTSPPQLGRHAPRTDAAAAAGGGIALQMPGGPAGAPPPLCKTPLRSRSQHARHGRAAPVSAVEASASARAGAGGAARGGAAAAPCAPAARGQRLPLAPPCGGTCQRPPGHGSCGGSISSPPAAAGAVSGPSCHCSGQREPQFPSTLRDAGGVGWKGRGPAVVSSCTVLLRSAAAGAAAAGAILRLDLGLRNSEVPLLLEVPL